MMAIDWTAVMTGFSAIVASLGGAAAIRSAVKAGASWVIQKIQEYVQALRDEMAELKSDLKDCNQKHREAELQLSEVRTELRLIRQHGCHYINQQGLKP